MMIAKTWLLAAPVLGAALWPEAVQDVCENCRKALTQKQSVEEVFAGEYVPVVTQDRRGVTFRKAPVVVVNDPSRGPAAIKTGGEAIEGVVVNSNGSPVEGAAVRIDVGRGVYVVTSDSDGRFAFVDPVSNGGTPTDVPTSVIQYTPRSATVGDPIAVSTVIGTGVPVQEPGLTEVLRVLTEEIRELNNEIRILRSQLQQSQVAGQVELDYLRSDPGVAR